MDSWNPRNDAWLAGFADGEGCFSITPVARAGGSCTFYSPTFAIKLRADDVAVLERLREAFGGRLSYNDKRSYDWDSKPQWSWAASSKRDLAVLVAYFDRFPLRAKKARDYAIWRRAVKIYCAQGGVDHDGQLASLRRALRAGRAFDADMDTPDPESPFAPQLALGID